MRDGSSCPHLVISEQVNCEEAEPPLVGRLCDQELSILTIRGGKPPGNDQ